MWIQQSASSIGPRDSVARANASHERRRIAVVDLHQRHARRRDSAERRAIRRDAVTRVPRAPRGGCEHPGPADDDRVSGPLQLGEGVGRVDVDEQPVGQLERHRVDTAQRQLAGGDTLLEGGQELPRVRAGKRNARRRHGRRLAERPQRARSHQRDVDGQRDDDLVARMAQARDHTVDGRPRRRPVVEHREGQVVCALADDEHFVADLAEQALCALRERLASEPRQRLR